MKHLLLFLTSFFCQNLLAQTDTLEWLLQQANAPAFDWHQLAGKTPKKDLLEFINQSTSDDYVEGAAGYDGEEEDGAWEKYILQYFEYCDVNRDGREDIINSGWRFGYRWTQIAFASGNNKYSAWVHLPGQIQYFKQTASETIIATYGEGCCGYSPDIMALVSFPEKDPAARFKYHAFLEGITFIKDSFPIAYKRPFKTRQAITIKSYRPDSTEEAEFETCDLGCYDKGARGIALLEEDYEGKLWYLALMPPGAGMRYAPERFLPFSLQWRTSYYAVGWVEAEELDFD